MLRALHEELDPNKVMIRSMPKKMSQSIEKSLRGSKYRGVSKNGTKWQVMNSYIIC